MKMKNNVSKWMSFAAVLLYCAATFHIVDEHFLLGTVFFAAAVCFTSAAATCRKKERAASGDAEERNE